jgi:circadian clock protein KaiC
MSEDETASDGDWFEEALREEDSGAADDPETPAATPDDGEEAAEEPDDAEESATGTADPEESGDAGASEDDTVPDDGSGPSADDPADWGDGDASPFGDAAESAFGQGDSADADWSTGGTAAGAEGDAASSPFVDVAGEAPGGAGAGGGGMFDDDFASAFQGAGGGEEDLDGEYHSEIPRIDLGVTGLDEMIQGGIPERHLLTCIGGPGSGKTTFGLQFLNHGIKNDQDGVFITLEQSHEAILDTAEEHGWPFEEYEAEGSLAIVDLDPVEMANSLDNIRGELPGLIEQFGADRLVMDSVSLLEMMYDDQARRRTEVFDFTRSLKKAGVTTFMTSEASEDNPYASRHGIIEYLTDAVFVLQYVRGETQETRLAVEIQKIRNANHSREKKPYELTSEGIDVYQQANIF